ncbi:phosphotransferase family protein [Penicillium brevicompactum]|uniref:phosphotransferase family protein n=1 Tax=Penicillium brevicompactum TaxID=5074 RepID=UPI002541F697|nr:phosphotransferase family protein [Penicillium brevicompactum]KAJ5348736.1 phosphotransferase family protein [Penicillium brevicompactum]
MDIHPLTIKFSYNDHKRQYERRRAFNVPELKRLAATSVHRKAEDVSTLEKLAEGGFNRSFLVTMNDGFQLVARIPYPVTEPKFFAIASEVATMDFLRSQGIPVPKVVGYSASSDNAAETEYIFMELVQGNNLGDIWFELSEKERINLVYQIVRMESRLLSLRFPASGSLYYSKDLQDKSSWIDIPSTQSTSKRHFCIGPDTTLGLWYGKRCDLPASRGPSALTAGAKKEIAYLMKFGQPLQPLQRLRREIYNYQTQSHFEHIASLKKYLHMAPYLIPQNNSTITRPVMRHPDLQPNNIFVSDKLEVTGLIDWQPSVVLPLFLQCGIPRSIQNYSNEVSESLQIPRLPDNINDLKEREQFEQVELLRRRQLHHSYVNFTAKYNSEHYDALEYDMSTLRRQLFHHASAPWEGDNVSLRAD